MIMKKPRGTPARQFQRSFRRVEIMRAKQAMRAHGELSLHLRWTIEMLLEEADSSKGLDRFVFNSVMRSLLQMADDVEALEAVVRRQAVGH